MAKRTAGADRGTDTRQRFQAFFANLCARFLNQPSDLIGTEIDGALPSLAALLEVDRCLLALFSADLSELDVAHSFTPPGAPGLVHEDLARALPWYVQQLRDGERVLFESRSSLERLPREAEAEKRFFTSAGWRAHAAIPLVADRTPLGMFGVATITRDHEWSEELLARLDLLGSAFACALYRRSADARIRATEELNRSVLRSLSSEVLALDGAGAARRACADAPRVAEGVASVQLEAENAAPRREASQAPGATNLVGRSAALVQVLNEIERIAPTDSPVLLLGETGTGKDLAARAVHDQSRRREGPFVRVNCATLPFGLVESELFGHERGAFTGAHRRSKGRFALADNGTLFLDEIGELSLDVQAKLLRALEGGEFSRLGSPHTIKSNVRIIAATNRDLAAAIRDGRFRADLYYRLGVFPLVMPPLRQRREDIPRLVWHFVALKENALGKCVQRIPDDLMQAFVDFLWPGNVRELEHVVERALILTHGPTLADPDVLGAPVTAVPLDRGHPTHSRQNASCTAR